MESKRSGVRSVRRFIQQNESLTFGYSCGENIRNVGFRAGKSPGHEDPFVLGLPVGKEAAIVFFHFPIECLLRSEILSQRQTKVCVTKAATQAEIENEAESEAKTDPKTKTENETGAKTKTETRRWRLF
jgi:hypothetical protein